jgi:hypothetical protein
MKSRHAAAFYRARKRSSQSDFINEKILAIIPDGYERIELFNPSEKVVSRHSVLEQNPQDSAPDLRQRRLIISELSPLLYTTSVLNPGD